MAKFLFVYFGGEMETDPKKTAKSMKEWTKWFEDLGKAVVEMGAPVQPGKMVSGSGARNAGTAKPVSGYSIVQARSMAAAVKMAKSSPQIKANGQIGVYEIAPM